MRQRLLELASSSDRQKFAQIQELYPEIEAALEAGASRSQITAALRAEGLDISDQLFTNYVNKIRHRIEADDLTRRKAGLPPLRRRQAGEPDPVFEGAVFEDDDETPSPAQPKTGT